MLSFFPRGVLDEILNLIESVSEDFPSYSSIFKDRSVTSYILDYFENKELPITWYRYNKGRLKSFRN